MQPECSCWRKFDVQHQRAIGAHARWDCPLRYYDVFNECPGFNRDGSRDPAQWHGENLTRAAKDAWVALIAREDLMVPLFEGAGAPPFSA